ncbi:MAG: DegT/DnrJ/EryC1/StrS aminotransferase family protein [Peptococcaceae bacterium]|nr:DegT/DnrJ/EryC1/StrS aminotransferase family protein [Peptococcaceae bacterium]
MQFIDLQAQYESLKAKIDNNIQKVLNHGKFIMGPEVDELERELSAYVGTKHCITCANGTDALQMIYMAYGIGQGDAVFCPDVTFISSVEPACMLGATPVFCDIDPISYNISTESLERQIEAVTQEGRLNLKAVVAVDFLGNLADYETLSWICRKYNLLLIEDAAQSFGASDQGRKAASFGNAAITSFFPAKPLGCYGDGGAIFTNDDNIAGLCKSLRIHGKGPKGKYDNVRIGLNSRLDTIQAAILLAKFEAFREREIDLRQKVAARYNQAFKQSLTVPHINSGNTSVYAQYTLLAEHNEQRNRIIEFLTGRNIPNMIYYPTPQHKLPVFSSYASYGEIYETANNYCLRTFSLPMHPYLTRGDQDIVIQSVLEAIE